MNATAARAFRILGTTDEVDACDCCGKTGLKSTVAVVELDADGNDVSDTLYFGCTCAARAAAREVKEIRREAHAADRAREQAERDAKARAYNERRTAWLWWLRNNSTSFNDEHRQMAEAARKHGIDFEPGPSGMPRPGNEFWRVREALEALAGVA